LFRAWQQISGNRGHRLLLSCPYGNVASIHVMAHPPDRTRRRHVRASSVAHLCVRPLASSIAPSSCYSSISLSAPERAIARTPRALRRIVMICSARSIGRRFDRDSPEGNELLLWLSCVRLREHLPASLRCGWRRHAVCRIKGHHLSRAKLDQIELYRSVDENVDFAVKRNVCTFGALASARSQPTGDAWRSG